jgi:hypothetical protein
MLAQGARRRWQAFAIADIKHNFHGDVSCAALLAVWPGASD